MVKKRRRHSTACKSWVALEALEGSKNPSQSSSEHEIHPNMASRFSPENGQVLRISSQSFSGQIQASLHGVF